MQLATKHVVAPITRSPTDGSGTFAFLIRSAEIDSDHERIESFRDPLGRVPLGFAHVNNPEKGVADVGAFIGEAFAHRDPVGLRGSAKLDIANNPMAVAVYERLLMDPSDPLHLGELSIGFSFDPSITRTGPAGERVIVDARLHEISVVSKGAQSTSVYDIKERRRDPELARLVSVLDALEFGTARAKTATPDAVDEFIRADKQLRERERAEAAATEALIASLSIPPGTLLPSLQDDLARDREEYERTVEQIRLHDEQRAAEAEQRDRVDAARRGGDVQVFYG